VYSGKCWPQARSLIRRLRSVHGKTSRRASCQPKPIPHGIKQSKSFAVAQDVVPPVPLTSENQDHCHSASPFICVPFGRFWEKQCGCQKVAVFRQQRNSLICFEITAKREICEI
jgi:hypothetical protein